MTINKFVCVIMDDIVMDSTYKPKGKTSSIL